jgi:4-hydroxybenzoate polyprenyltransferase
MTGSVPAPVAGSPLLRSARSLALSSHPGPTAAVTVLTAVLGLATGLAPWALLALTLAVLAGQLSIGFSNDAIDARRDAAVGRTDKPIAAGDISRRTVAAAAGVALLVALVLSALLGAGVLVAHGIVIAGGWAYNAWLKRTAFSVLPFIVSFGTLPSLATLAQGAPDGEPTVAATWAGITGAVLGVSIHFTNALPDLADDRRTGVRGLPHRLGRRPAGAIAFVALGVGAVVVLVGPSLENGAAPGVVELLGFVATLGIALAGLVRVRTRPADRTLFRLVMAAGLLIAVQLALGSVRLGG